VVPLASLLPKAPRCSTRRPRWPGNHRPSRSLRSARHPKVTALALRSDARSPPEGARASSATTPTRRWRWPRSRSSTQAEARCCCVPEAGDSLPDGRCPWAASVTRRCCLSRSLILPSGS